MTRSHEASSRLRPTAGADGTVPATLPGLQARFSLSPQVEINGPER
jgi:hypothetical protein